MYRKLRIFPFLHSSCRNGRVPTAAVIPVFSLNPLLYYIPPLLVFSAEMECLLAYPGETILMKPAPEKHIMYYVLTSAVALAIIVQILIKILR